MNSDFQLINKVSLITGGGTGIGFGIAQAFIKAGAKVIISGRREDVLKSAVNKLGHNANYIVNDISNLSKIPDFIKQVETKIGAIDILINNAGIHHKQNSFETSDSDFKKILDTNLTSVFAISREVAKSMKDRKSGGSIIMISSMAALFSIDRVAAYSVSKAGVLGMMYAMVADFSIYGIRVNSIAPGWIESEMMLKAVNSDLERKEKILGRIPTRTFGKSKDIGNAALFLCSDAATYVNGVILRVDGGASIGF